MKLIFTFDEIHQLIRNHVEDNMHLKFDQIEFNVREDDFCILTQSDTAEKK